MKVSEIFTSIQGEGIYVGVPMTFIRFAGCNIVAQCQAGCDTPEAGAILAGDDMSVTDIYMQVDPKVRYVCFTGGEPVLQQDGWFPLAAQLTRTNRHLLTLETNGTLTILERNRRMFEWVCVSPKTSDIRSLPGIAQANEVKFLVNHPNTFSTSEDFMHQRQRAIEINPAAEHTLQPWLTDDEEENERTTMRAVFFCTDNDIRLSIQLHKYLDIR